jgi:hypothetical protein
MTPKKVAVYGLGAALVTLTLACSGGGTGASAGTKDQPIAGGKAATSKPAAKKPNPNQITGDGTFAVPSQVKPGSYRAVVPQDSFGCYYERRKDASGELSGIIANDNAESGAQVIVQVKSTDKYFKTQGCGTWTKVG